MFFGLSSDLINNNSEGKEINKDSNKLKEFDTACERLANPEKFLAASGTLFEALNYLYGQKIG